VGVSMMPRPELVNLVMRLHYESGGAILVSEDGEEAHAVWLPKSQVEWADMENGRVEVTCPVWLAKDKGLI
jgi:hypothetical protein